LVQPLKLLFTRERVRGKVLKMGVVGVGEVTKSVQFAKDFMVLTPVGDRPVLDVLQH
jgi:hypothetical protein